MTEATEQTPIAPETLRRGHEPTAVSLRGFVVFLAVFAVSMAIVLVAIFWIMRGLSSLERGAAPIAQRENDGSSSIAVPVLQPSPAQGDKPREPYQDMQAFHKHEESILNSYGPANPETGAARIPITRAIELMLERKSLPTATTQPAGGAR